MILLLITKILTKIFIDYSNFTNNFLSKTFLKLLKHIYINNYTINLKNNQYLFYRLINSLKLIKLKILKIYIKIYLFIKSFSIFLLKFLFFSFKI